MRDKINVKIYLTIWGIAIFLRLATYMYALCDPDGYVENYSSFSFIDPVASIVIAVANIIALQKCIKIVDEVCPGNKKTPGAIILILSLGFTLGIYDWIILKDQLTRIENKCRENMKSTEAQKVKPLFLGWYIFSLILICKQRVGGTYLETMDDYQDYVSTVVAICVITWVLFACFVLKYTAAINDAIEAGNIHLQNERMHQEEERKKAEEQRLKQEQEELRKLKEREEEKKLEEEKIIAEQKKKEQQERERRQKAFEPATRLDRSLWHYSLTCIEGEYEGMDIPLEEDEFVMLGRNAGTVNIVFTNASVSGLHCQVRYSVDDDCFQVVDFSSYGTFVDGKKLEKGELVNCKPGSVLDLGKTGNRFRMVAERRL